MSMVVAFTITPWLAYQVLHRKFSPGGGGGHGRPRCPTTRTRSGRSRLYQIFYPLMGPLLHSRLTAAGVPAASSAL